MTDPMEQTTLEFLAGGGEMGKRIREFDWDATELGAPRGWPQSLKTCIRIMLSSKQPIWIGWGPRILKFYNDAYIDIVRGKHPHALGEPVSVVWKDIWKDIEPMLSRAMDRDEGTYVESRLLIMVRSGFPEETYYTFSYTPVLGDDGRPAGIICYNTADTERILSERALKTMQQLDSLGEKKREEEVFRQVERALSANPLDFPFAFLYKISEDGAQAGLVATSGADPNDPELDKHFRLADSGERYDQLVSTVRQNRMTEAINRGQWKQLATGGWDVAPKYVVYLPIQSASRKFPLALLAVGLNPYRKFDEAYRNFLQQIADRIALGLGNVMAYEEEQRRLRALEELNQAKTLFFTNISHEFRTPLMLMLGPLEELLNHDVSQWSEAERVKVEVTHRNALRLLKLVNTLLDFSRMEGGRNHARFVETDLAGYTRNLASNFRSVIEKAGVRFDVKVGNDACTAYVDRTMWEKVVFNLLSNAFKYTLEGKITLELYEHDGSIRLVVSDTGVGIPKHELPHMFERFHRVQNAGGRTYEGTGIGLSLIKELVDLHHGRITVESTEGVGSAFTVTIPAGNQHLDPSLVSDSDTGVEEAISDFFVREAETLLAPEYQAERMTNGHADNRKDCILIADDNADMRQHIQSLLGGQFRTLTAPNGVEALRLIRQHRPALVLSDIMMPEMDGIALLKAVKTDPEIGQTPIILITARAGEESRIEGIEIGADDYIVKPFSSKELIVRTQAQIRMSGARNKIEASEKQFRILTETLPQLIWMTDETGRQIFASGRWVEYTGIPPMEARFWQQIIHPDDLDGIKRSWVRSLRTGQRHHAEVRFRSKTGEYRWYVGMGEPIRNESGKIINWIGAFSDVHDQRIFTEELERKVEQRTQDLVYANKELESFNYVASHDLQEPLRKIQTFIHLIERNKFDSDLSKGYFQKIYLSAQRMSELIQSVLTYSRLSQNGETLQQVDLNKVIEDIRFDFELAIQEKQAKVISDHLPVVTANPLQMNQLFANLISNSLKFSTAMPEIRISSSREKGRDIPLAPPELASVDYHHLCVKDNGIGFEPEFNEKIFTLFQRLHRKSEYAGTGIGLSIVKKIVEQHEGFVSAESHADEGATFHIWLPA
ncbi:ATP-binding protein [Dyadobacter sp. CY261]|uniref:sensor histidine kinase n=1 Tax=Dyadobacter sp. CY261 TaxID=2907203 RepID=UPI001F181997|nr:ATP-binding protein [Dyadobacter sp. CY261]MCF0074735.1 ATP-binding protein [Dyadobacter sp. CY261]